MNNQNNKQVIIDHADLEKIEQTRLAIYDFVEQYIGELSTQQLVQLTNITNPLWKIANKIHPEFKGETFNEQ